MIFFHTLLCTQFQEHVKELERVFNGLQQSVQSLWQRLEIPLEQQTEILDQIESYGPHDIQMVIKGVLFHQCCINVVLLC